MINVGKRMAIVAASRACLGTPWQHQGRLPGLGLDCIGLAAQAAAAAGEDTSKVPFNYGHIPHLNKFYKFMETEMVRIPIEKMLAGDLLLLCWRSYPMHIAVIADFNHHGGVHDPFSIIHAIVGNTNRVGEQALDLKHQRAAGLYRLPSLVREEAE